MVWLPHIPKISLARHMQFVMDSCGEISCADLWNSLSWHVYSRFWLHSILYQTIVWLQHHQLYDCHSCQMSHYPMSSQRCVHIYVMRLCGKWCIIYWKDGDRQCTWGSLKSGKITFLSLNKPVLSNIYDTERKQGQRRAFIDIMIGEDCHRTQVGETTKVKSGIVFGGSAY